MTDAVDLDRPPKLTHLGLFLRFLKFGGLAFGGPVAQIAMIKRDLVERERWMEPAHFNRLLAVMQVLPGPEAHELCVHLGIRAKGRLGGLLAGLGFMLPGLLLMMGVAWAYVSLDLAQGPLEAAFLGVQVAVIAVIARAVHRIGAHILEDWMLWALAIGAAIATLGGVSFWIVLIGAGLIYGFWKAGRRWAALAVVVLTVLSAVAHLALDLESGVGWPGAVVPLADEAVGVVALFIAGLKAGLLTFGGAYTAIPYVRDDTVSRGWLSDAQFLDGVAFAGVLPAPLVIFATFVGFVAGGPLGALAITVGIFLPAFAFSMVFYERLEQVMDMPRLQALLAGVAAAVVGIIAATTLQLGVETAQRVPSLWQAGGLFLAALATAWFWKSKWNALVVLLGAAVFGALLFSAR